MYYEEQIIDGILSYRHSPNAEFTPFTAKELSQRVVQLKSEIKRLTVDIKS